MGEEEKKKTEEQKENPADEPEKEEQEKPEEEPTAAKHDTPQNNHLKEVITELNERHATEIEKLNAAHEKEINDYKEVIKDFYTKGETPEGVELSPLEEINKRRNYTKW